MKLLRINLEIIQLNCRESSQQGRINLADEPDFSHYHVLKKIGWQVLKKE